jgi:hypothetical protein
MGGLGILDIHKFGRSLRLRWSWYEWTDLGPAWAGLGNPCNDDDMNLFYASINPSIGNGKIAMFWHSPWLRGVKPKDIAPPSSTSPRKNSR